MREPSCLWRSGCRGISGADFFLNFLFDGDGDVFVLDVEAEAVIEAHVDVGDVDQGEPADEVAAPAGIEELETCDEQEKGGDIVGEAVLAGEEVEELALGGGGAALASFFAELARLAKELLVRDGPGGAGDGNGEQNEVGELMTERKG